MELKPAGMCPFRTFYSYSQYNTKDAAHKIYLKKENSQVMTFKGLNQFPFGQFELNSDSLESCGLTEPEA